MTIAEYLIKLKMLLGITLDDTSKDERLTFVLETVVQAVLVYCNITAIPKALNNVILVMSEDYYRGKYPTEFEQAPAAVTSVKRGDVQTNFGSAKPVVKVGSGADFVQSYESQLIAFRKLRW
ncbi:phage head-tail connector protein [Paenibacillus periandrae]|uniref:phage head-tail connector protein n=1 Tax=Paenibacillus periandrae TaxID=1761741 RepID=UPI001F0908CE|nr:phage head-tail connector protein [Paenibacillus periandrae]